MTKKTADDNRYDNIPPRQDGAQIVDWSNPCAANTDRIVGKQRLRLRHLSPLDGERVMALRDSVIASLPDSTLYVREKDDEAFVRRHCRSDAGSFGIFDGTALVAYGMLTLPPLATQADRAKRHVDGVPQEWTSAYGARTAQLASCMVAPTYRGRGLQRQLIAARLQSGIARGERTFWAMVSPYNLVSRDNLQNAGLRPVWSGNIDGVYRIVVACTYPAVSPHCIVSASAIERGHISAG